MISTLKFPKLSYTGWGSIEKLFVELKNMNPKKVLIVTDETLVNIGIIDKYLNPLKHNYEVSIYTDVEPEPSLACGQKLVEFTRSENFECVIGIGGGSTLDLAKMTAVVSKNNGDVEDYLNLNGTKRLNNKGLLKILIPTTSGTGSEVTDIAVFSLQGTKDVIAHDYLLADIAIVDPQLTMTLPKRVTAATGVDALTHAVEAYLSIHANETTDALAIKAIELISGSLIRAVDHGDDVEARTAMSYGSYLAGLAFFNAGVAGVHALAYPLGSQFKLPHGESNAVLLPYVMNYIASSCNEKLNQVCKILDVSYKDNNAQEILAVFYQLVEKVGLPTTLREYGIPEKALEILTDDAIKQKRLLARSPLTLGREDIYEIYSQAYKGISKDKCLIGGNEHV
jgi:alcohol dehydrogenase